jgi:non-ribosomal peptide synthetase component F
MPFFRVVFILQNAPVSTPVSISQPQEMPSMSVKSEAGMATFDLTMSMMETSQGLIGTLQYAADLFDEVGIKKMLAHFRALLENLVEDPDQSLSSIRLFRDLEIESRRLSDFPLDQREMESILIELDSLPGR